MRCAFPGKSVPGEISFWCHFHTSIPLFCDNSAPEPHSTLEQSLLSSSLFTDPENTADAFVYQLHIVVTSILDKLAPFRTVSRISGSSHINRFTSQKAIHAKRYRRRLERNWKKTGAEADRLAYRQQCKVANNLIIESRKDHFAKRIADMNAGSKQRWSAVNELLHSKDRSSPPQPNEAKQPCNTISSFFSNKVCRMKDTIASRLAGLIHNPFVFDDAHCGPLAHGIHSGHTRWSGETAQRHAAKSSPMDFVPTPVLKKCEGVFEPLIARFANMSFSQGRFPAQFKLAQVSPLLKKAGMDVNNPASFRPISNLNTISKIIERLALTRLRPQITESTNFNILQSAYRQRHLTETALLNILNDSYGHIDSGRSTLPVALDLSAAFDTTEHSVLLTRLQKSFGVTGMVGNWITSYLTDRSQFMHVGSESSAVTDCSCGVPQGSVLGPLFL